MEKHYLGYMGQVTSVREYGTISKIKFPYSYQVHDIADPTTTHTQISVSLYIAWKVDYNLIFLMKD
jgi:hypothetical protein